MKVPYEKNTMKICYYKLLLVFFSSHNRIYTFIPFVQSYTKNRHGADKMLVFFDRLLDMSVSVHIVVNVGGGKIGC